MFLYRLLVSVFAIVTLWRAFRAGGLAAMRDRLSPGPAPAGPHVWLHGASNGELASVKPLLDAMIAARPDLRWLITANTDTGVALARGWDLPRTSVHLAPIDLRGPAKRTMRLWHVTAHIALESELWPNRILACPGPTVLLGARMTPGTARTWARFPRLTRRMLARVRYASAQDAGSADRLAALGLPPQARGPIVDLKAFYDPPPIPEDPTLTAAYPRARTWLAASTHAGEEETVLDAHKALLIQHPHLKLILAPRHPRRAEEIAAAAHTRGLTCARRSLDQSPETAQVYIADTMGEMPRWYARAGRVFIGGTLTDRGGHTPYEPAAFGAALLHGPDTANFAAAFARLAEAKAAYEIDDAETLAAALAALTDAEAQATAGQAAQQALRQEADPVAVITPVLALLPKA
ncbi:3-deoxy-D-manno-octulosonic acid transferase [Maliponia aquimaris]|uniref:3-deoxy-D-manno-octulosonic acid transferase n=1 Tax=Maliponia aquimaris TaxID=1673631 RepID=A0A238KHL6_9RHOB|nr:glycosyltransferase N-terminal domain-containing protein [Maliponia aquimaris]SMX42084.1 3-deoxy-D-manno-octulosonic acid transferase [Maliponia aquimaris]